MEPWEPVGYDTDIERILVHKGASACGPKSQPGHSDICTELSFKSLSNHPNRSRQPNARASQGCFMPVQTHVVRTSNASQTCGIFFLTASEGPKKSGSTMTDSTSSRRHCSRSASSKSLCVQHIDTCVHVLSERVACMTHTHTLTHSHTHTLTHSLTHSHSHSLTLTHTHTHNRYLHFWCRYLFAERRSNGSD